MRRLLQNLLVLAVSTLICALGLEGFLRLRHVDLSFSMPDRTIGFRLRPNARYRWTEEGFSEGRINPDGWRDATHAATKRPGTTRILFCGDSYTEALQVPLDSTFHRRLERQLDPRAGAGRHVEVIALGRSGMGTTEELLTYEKWGRRYQPDVVAVLFVLNDFTDNTKGLDPHPDIRPYFVFSGDTLALDTSFVNSSAFRARVRLDPLKARSRLVALATKSWNDWRARRAFARSVAANPAPSTPFEFDSRVPPDSVPAFRITAAVLARFAREVHMDGRRFVLFVAGDARQEDARQVADAARDPAFDPDRPERFLAGVGAREGFDVVPLAPAFRAASAAGSGPFWYRLNVAYGHWNSVGHALAAAVMAHYFESMHGL